MVKANKIAPVFFLTPYFRKNLPQKAQASIYRAYMEDSILEHVQSVQIHWDLEVGKRRLQWQNQSLNEYFS